MASAPVASANSIPLSDRTLSIQVVRGSKNQSVEFGGDAGAGSGATPGAAADVPAGATPDAAAPATAAAAPAAR